MARISPSQRRCGSYTLEGGAAYCQKCSRPLTFRHKQHLISLCPGDPEKIKICNDCYKRMEGVVSDV